MFWYFSIRPHARKVIGCATRLIYYNELGTNMSAAVVLPLIFIWRFELWFLGIKQFLFWKKESTTCTCNNPIAWRRRIMDECPLRIRAFCDVILQWRDSVRHSQLHNMSWITLLRFLVGFDSHDSLTLWFVIVWIFLLFSISIPEFYFPG